MKKHSKIKLIYIMSVEQEVKKDITVSAVLALLDEGKSREEIAAHFGETVAAMKATVWQHPKLKNRKAKKQFAINLIDDTDGEANTNQEVDFVEEEAVQQVIDTVESENQDDVVVGETETVEETVAPPTSANGTW
ncbi:hypothetical protein [Flavobacterium phage FpV4]|uniref:Uncharacterized protein n=2 Tax=Fipvunavirus Fpv4 TaxID=2560476 RepID=A0A1B0WLD1_9CAUD|nr:hypothetical protein BOW80_gp59 [Flavobacterium phage Fpv3]YP_009594113.1 hypothetical protein FDG89_gp57 [Flavobacterium phage FpV4]ALN97170.1 hypothetical protein [Flavobacterium phage FpV4]ANB40461.1 hypothetical protein [Flavobacterium phage Fpv3]